MIQIGIPPDLVHAGGLMISWHSLISVASVALAVYLIDRWGKQAGLAAGVVSSVAWWAIPGGIVGARLVYVIDHWGYFSANPEDIVAVWRGGIAVYGAFAGGALAGALHAWRKGFPIRRLFDLSAPALILAQATGRIGDLINGEHFSTATDLPWGVVYTHPMSPASGLPASHPAVAYEMLADLALFGVLWLLRGRLRPQGSLFALSALGYSVIRFFLSFVRLDSNSAAWGLNQQAWISVLVFAGAAIALLLLKPWWDSSPSPSRRLEEETPAAPG